MSDVRAMESTPDVGEPWPNFGHARCCEEDYGGSHYHCARCDGVTGMYGHMTTLKPGDKWAKDRAAQLGVSLPFRGFTCDPHDAKADD